MRDSFVSSNAETRGLGDTLDNPYLNLTVQAPSRFSNRASFGAETVVVPGLETVVAPGLTSSLTATQLLTSTPTAHAPGFSDLLSSHTAFQEVLLSTKAVARNIETRQAAWDTLNQVWPDLVTDICPPGYRSRFLKSHQLTRPEKTVHCDFQASLDKPAGLFKKESLSKLNDAQLVALGESLGGSVLADFMADSFTRHKISHSSLKALLNQVSASKSSSLEPASNNAAQAQFSGFDPFGALFAVGLTTYVYGKIKQQKTAITVGKTLMLVGIVPNLILMGTAIAALVKVALFGVP